MQTWRRDWGVNADIALLDCGAGRAHTKFFQRSTFAVDKRTALLVAFAPSRYLDSLSIEELAALRENATDSRRFPRAALNLRQS
jgi:hypothetical protein